MNADGSTATEPVTLPPLARRADAGIVRIGGRDIAGLARRGAGSPARACP